MSNWKHRMEEAFSAFRAYRPGRYIDQFPELRAVALKQPNEMTDDDIDTLLWKSRHAGDRSLVSRCLPQIIEWYVQRRLYAHETRLHATLLCWLEAWSREQYEALTEAVLLHWQETVREHCPPHLTVTTDEIAFLLLWLEDTSPVEPILLDLAHRFYRQEVEFEWDDTWGSEMWTPFINRVRSEPIRTLLTYATGGELSWQDLVHSPTRDERVVSALRKTRIVLP